MGQALPGQAHVQAMIRVVPDGLVDGQLELLAAQVVAPVAEPVGPGKQMGSLPAFRGLVGPVRREDFRAVDGEAAQPGAHFGDHGAATPGFDLVLLACWEDHESTLKAASIGDGENTRTAAGSLARCGTLGFGNDTSGPPRNGHYHRIPCTKCCFVRCATRVGPP